MSRIDELIAAWCPEGVVHMPLGDVGEFIRGNGLQKSDLTDEGAPAIHYGQLHTHYGVWTDSTKSFTAPTLAAKLRRARPGDLIIVTTSEDDAAVAKATAWIGDGEVAVSGDAYIYRHSLDPRYVAYFFQSDSFQMQKTRHVSGSKVRRISGVSLAKIRIPVPPLEVQREIVRILDQFTQLQAELEAELEARRRQRVTLANNFSVDSRDARGVGRKSRRVMLGLLAKSSVEPVAVRPAQSYVSLGVKWNGQGVLVRDARTGSSIRASTLYRVRGGQLIYNRMFVVEGSIALVPKELDGAVVSGEFPLFELDTSLVEPEWLVQHLCDPYILKRIEGEVTGTERGSMKSRRRWKADQFSSFQVDLPSLEVQQEVVGALRAGDLLIQSLEDELAARRKQYEYYRERLLTFEEAVA